MPWSKPDFKEITLGMEVTAYVNTDEASVVSRQSSVVGEKEVTVSVATDHEPLTTDD